MKNYQDLAPLAAAFYLDHPDVVARKLLGKLLIRRIDGESLMGRIVEVEAYLGQQDPAAHAFAGMTARNEVLFGPPGRAYIYFIYGMHYCLNVSCEPKGTAGGVLFRALEPIAGLAKMASFRKLPSGVSPRLLTSGPGRLCQALDITRPEHNGINLTRPASALRIVDDGFLAADIVVTPRIGIRKASDMPLRFSSRKINLFQRLNRRSLRLPSEGIALQDKSRTGAALVHRTQAFRRPCAGTYFSVSSRLHTRASPGTVRAALSHAQANEPQNPA